jgi:hypothetical protein
MFKMNNKSNLVHFVHVWTVIECSCDNYSSVGFQRQGKLKSQIEIYPFLVCQRSNANLSGQYLTKQVLPRQMDDAFNGLHSILRKQSDFV